jgi:hypothetical protein
MHYNRAMVNDDYVSKIAERLSRSESTRETMWSRV